MPMIQADDGVRLYAESTGSGTPMLFIHEFAGDHRSWEPQVQYFSAALECITYSARGYPPSDVPADPAAYSQQRAVDRGAWRQRDPRSLSASTTGMTS
jgi:pimeloyl-ACP methyl ester carboxylesterase